MAEMLMVSVRTKKAIPIMVFILVLIDLKQKFFLES